MALIPPDFIDCVVAIGAGPKRKRSWIASGFLYGVHIGGSGTGRLYQNFLVTNRHVVAGKWRICLRFNPQGGQPAREYDITLKGKNAADWTFHPNKAIDIAVIPININLLVAEGMQIKQFTNDISVADRAKMVADGITEGDYVYVLGFPMGLVGVGRNAVIVRSGSIARIRDTLVGIDQAFLIDAFVFPGNSGGPVVSKPELTALTGTHAHKAPYLIGIVRAYLPYVDLAVSQQTGEPRMAFHENSGLAEVHPVDYIEESIQECLRKFPILQSQRDQALNQGP